MDKPFQPAAPGTTCEIRDCGNMAVLSLDVNGKNSTNTIYLCHCCINDLIVYATNSAPPKSPVNMFKKAMNKINNNNMKGAQ